jgi:hypothetical protein
MLRKLSLLRDSATDNYNKGSNLGVSGVNRVIALLAAVAVLWHTTAGCCAHHAHACSAAGVCVAGHDHSHDCQSSEHDHAAHSPGDLPVEPGSEHAPASTCGGDVCSFAAPDAPVTIDQGADTVGVLLEEGKLPLRLTSAQGVANSACTGPFNHSDSALYLALGVLLI